MDELRDHPDFGTHGGSIKFGELFDQPIIILGRRTGRAGEDKGGGEFDIWEIELDGKLYDTIPWSGAAVLYRRYLLTHPNDPAVKVVVHMDQNEKGRQRITMKKWSDEYEAAWSRMVSGEEQVPF